MVTASMTRLVLERLARVSTVVDNYQQETIVGRILIKPRFMQRLVIFFHRETLAEDVPAGDGPPRGDGLQPECLAKEKNVVTTRLLVRVRTTRLLVRVRTTRRAGEYILIVLSLKKCFSTSSYVMACKICSTS